MAQERPTGDVFERLDQLYEFERQPVGEDRLQPGRYFAASYMGEHIAATEFVIGALFVTWGASAHDVLVGLLVGNLLAVLSWAWVCAPIAVQTRLTLYWYLRRIAGPVVTVLYNVLNAVLYCILAGCMITVAASAIRIPFGIAPQVGWLASDPWFYPLVIGVGAVVVVLAILGFKRLAQFSAICSPWMLLMFLLGAVVLLPTLGPVGGVGGFWDVAAKRVWTGPPPYLSMAVEGDRLVLEFDPAAGPLVASDAGRREVTGFALAGKGPGEERFVPAAARVEGSRVVLQTEEIRQPTAARYDVERDRLGNLYFAGPGGDPVRPVPPFYTYVRRRADVIGFWHVAGFAWICCLAMHLGLSDMALLRYACRASYGYYSAFGMLLGHYLAWICAGIMGAAVAGVGMLDRPLTELDAGEVAYQALGAMGALAVVVAGWTTANPTLYRAGLALQVITPGWPRWLVTLIAGAITTVMACSPFVFRHLLGFVAIYGILLAPIGAIVVAEHWLFPRLGWTRFWSARKGQSVNVPALASWLAGVGLAAAAWVSKQVYGQEIVHEFFLVIPVWILTTGLYLGLAAWAGARQALGELPDVLAPAPVAAPRRQVAGAAVAAAASLSPLERVFLWLSGLVALAALGYWIPTSLAAAWSAGQAPGPVAEVRAGLGPWQIAFFAAAALWLHLREKATAYDRRLHRVAGAIALLSLVAAASFAATVFLGYLTPAPFKDHLVVATVVYFAAAVTWLRQGAKRKGETTR